MTQMFNPYVPLEVFEAVYPVESFSSRAIQVLLPSNVTALSNLTGTQLMALAQAVITTAANVATIPPSSVPSPPVVTEPAVVSYPFSGLAAGQTITLVSSVGSFSMLVVNGLVQVPTSYFVSGAILTIPAGLVWDTAACDFLYTPA